MKRVKIQKEQMQHENILFKYKTTLNDIDIKLKELKLLLYKKAQIEHEHKDSVDFEEKDLHKKMDAIN